MTTPSLIVISDMQNALFRAYHAMKHSMDLREPGKVPTPEEAVEGFQRILNKLPAVLGEGDSPVKTQALTEASGIFYVHAWDGGGASFRHRLYPEYKGTRATADEAVLAALELAKRTMDGPGTLRVLGWEADDVIATLVAQCRDHDSPFRQVPIVVATSDRDLLTLTALPRVYQLVPMGKLAGWVTQERFQRVLGFPPLYLPDYKALRGDDSDGIPGTPGWGEKYATAAVSRYGYLENIFTPEVFGASDGRFRRLITEENFAEAKRWRRLTRLNRDVPGISAARLFAQE